jgi:hypothetical protein
MIPGTRHSRERNRKIDKGTTLRKNLGESIQREKLTKAVLYDVLVAVRVLLK